MGKIYSVIESDDDNGSINYLIKIDFSHPVFKGHFPAKAVLPGVMMCDIIRHLISEKLGIQVQLSFAKNIKFSKMIIPSKNNTYNVMVSIKENEKKYNIKAIVSQSEDIYFKINAQYQIK